jgi:glycosyltransferase involved in cell wall biosynthesis
MRICFVAEDYYYNGGGERILALLCNALIKNYDITILSLLRAKNKSNYLLDKKVVLKNGNISRLYWGGFTKILECQYLNKNIDYLESFDIVMGLGIVPNFLLGMIAARIKKTKLIGWEHSSYTGSSFIFNIIRNIFYRKLNILVILTNRDLNKFEKINKNVIVINNFIVERVSKAVNLYENKKFLFVGRMEKEKGIDYFAKVIKKYYKISNLPWACKIIGDGHYRNWLARFVRHNNLNHVEMLSSTTIIEQEYGSASCFLLTSRFEGFPMVLLEASSFGLPIISFDCETGPSEIIRDGFNGFLVPPHNINLFVEKMIKLQNDHEIFEQFSENIYETSEKYMLNNIIPKWMDLFESFQ